MVLDESLAISRRRALLLAAGVGSSLIAGCQDAEVGSVPPASKKRQEITGEDRSGKTPPITKTKRK